MTLYLLVLAWPVLAVATALLLGPILRRRQPVDPVPPRYAPAPTEAAVHADDVLIDQVAAVWQEARR